MAFNFKNLFRKSKDPTPIKQATTDFYDRTDIDATGAQWRLIIGQRSNGKSYSVCRTIIDDYLEKGKRACYVRRYEEQITPKNIQTLFDPHLKRIEELSNGKYNSVFYRAKCFYLCYADDEGKITDKDPTPFCITRAVNTWETTKGADVGIIHLICYDEFLTREQYLKDEFVMFVNLCSSLIRNREDCVIYCIANTVNTYAPYWKEFGIEGVDKMRQGEIRVYTYPNSKMKLAIEYCAKSLTTKEVNDSFFAFQNAQLDMIKNGGWEMASYPKAPYPIYSEDITYEFYIIFGEQCLKGQIVHPRDKVHKNDLFIFFHRQTKDIEISNNAIMYTDQPDTSLLHVRYLKDCPTRVHTLIKDLILKNNMYFADNEVGEIVRNFLLDQGIKNLL